MKKKEPMKYRPCVGIVLIKDGLIFAGKRIDYKSDAWQMPQGGIELGETSRKAAFRELKEETGLLRKNLEMVCETEGWLKYDLPTELVPRLWGGRYIGQKQKWYAVNYFGSDEDININTESPEFCAWRWMKKDKILEKIVPFKKVVYESVFSQFADKVDLQ